MTVTALAETRFVLDRLLDERHALINLPRRSRFRG
jgi:hypothetical protein